LGKTDDEGSDFAVEMSLRGLEMLDLSTQESSKNIGHGVMQSYR